MENKTTYYYAVEQFIKPPADAPTFYHKERFQAGSLVRSRRAAFEYFFDRLQTIHRMRSLFNGVVQGALSFEPPTKTLNSLRMVFVECLPGGEQVEYYVLGHTHEAAAEAKEKETIIYKRFGSDLWEENRRVVEKYSKLVEELVGARKGERV